MTNWIWVRNNYERLNPVGCIPITVIKYIVSCLFLKSLAPPASVDVIHVLDTQFQATIFPHLKKATIEAIEKNIDPDTLDEDVAATIRHEIIHAVFGKEYHNFFCIPNQHCPGRN